MPRQGLKLPSCLICSLSDTMPEIKEKGMGSMKGSNKSIGVGTQLILAPSCQLGMNVVTVLKCWTEQVFEH